MKVRRDLDRGKPWVPLWASLRLAVRGILRDLPTAVTAGVILALGLAAPTAFFSVLWAGIRPLPVPDGDQIHAVEARALRSGEPRHATWDDLPGLGQAAGVQMAGFAEQPITLGTPEGGNIRVAGALLTPNALDVLRIDPMVGRVPDGDDLQEVLISHATWTTEFEADPTAVGTSVQVNGEPGTITGVLPQGFAFPFRQDAWVVSRQAGRVDPISIFARVPHGISRDDVAFRLGRRWPLVDGTGPGGETRVSIRPFTRGGGDAAETWIFAGLVVVGLALLGVATMNASILFLVRAVERSRVLAVQTALGAGRANIALQLLAESLLVALAGGALGIGLARFLMAYVETQASTTFGYWWMELTLEGPVLGFTGLLVLGSALVAGLAPVRRALRPDARGGGRDAGVLENPALSISYLTVSCAALAVAVMASDAVLATGRYGAGVDADRILVARVDPTLAGQASAERAEAIRRGVLEAVVDLGRGPGSAALSTGAPGYRETFARQDRGRGSEIREFTMVNAVTPGFHDLYPVPVVRGALPSPPVRSGDPVQAVVNTAWVDEFSPGADPVGSTLTLPGFAPGMTLQVTGVVETVRLGSGSAFREERVYLPLETLPAGPFTIQLRAVDDHGSILGTLRRAVEAVDPDLALEQPMTLDQAYLVVARSQRTLASLAAWGGYSTLIVALLGLHALLAFRVRRRRQEWGIRLALGADGSRLFRELAAYALIRVVPGAVLGLLVAWIAAPAVQAVLLGNASGRPAGLLGVGAVFVLSSLLAIVRPGITMSRTRPSTVLQGD